MPGNPLIGITIGDPAGIGSEVTLKCVAHPSVREICHLVVVGDARLLKRLSDDHCLPFPFHIIKQKERIERGDPMLIDLDNLPHQVEMGSVKKEYGRAAGEYLEAAVSLALKGEIDALVTGPINKKAFKLGGYDYAGHTEFLAALTGSNSYAMMFLVDNFRVAFLTTHLSLSEAVRQVKRDNIISLVRLVNREMKRFGFPMPRMAIAALNPHASEDGMFGREEVEEIIPAVEECQREGININGPYPADALFSSNRKGGLFDVIVALYHDQGSVPIKLHGFQKAVNITLGLPIIRTSVGHGTAFDIAGKGRADPSNMITATKLAVAMTRNTLSTNG